MSGLPLFPVSLVGSLPRPRWLIQVLRDRNVGIIPDIEWQMLGEHAVRDAVAIQESAGADLITDGEQRRDSFISFVAERLFGLRPMSLSERIHNFDDRAKLEERLQRLDVPSVALKNPIVSDRVRILNPNHGIVMEEVSYLAKQTSRPIRVALPGPYSFARSAWIQSSSARVYSSSDGLAEDLAVIIRSEVEQLREHGVAIVQIDEPALAALASDDASATFAGSLLPDRRNVIEERERAVELINAAAGSVEGIRTVVHVSQASWTRREIPEVRTDFTPLLPNLTALKVDQLSLGTASRDPSQLPLLAELSTTKEIGLGVVSARSDEVETPASIVEHVRQVVRQIPAERIFLTPDSGFAPFAERNLNTTETAQAKLQALVEAAKVLRSQ